MSTGSPASHSALRGPSQVPNPSPALVAAICGVEDPKPIAALQIPDEMASLQLSIQRLAEAVATLTGKLLPVLREDVAPKVAGGPVRERVPLADAIRSERWRVAELAGHLESLNDRLEL